MGIRLSLEVFYGSYHGRMLSDDTHENCIERNTVVRTKGMILRACSMSSLGVPLACNSRREEVLNRSIGIFCRQIVSLHYIRPLDLILLILHFSSQIRSENLEEPSISVLIRHGPTIPVQQSNELYYFIHTSQNQI